MSSGGHTHLILAGDSAWRLRYALPHHLSEKFIDVVDISRRANIHDIVTRSIAAFVEKEEQESLETVERLVREIRTDGLAVVGAEATLEALRFGVGDILVIAQSFDPEHHVKEKMVSLAEQHRCQIETVRRSEALDKLGGVGCLLRYRTRFPENGSLHHVGDQSEEPSGRHRDETVSGTGQDMATAGVASTPGSRPSGHGPRVT